MLLIEKQSICQVRQFYRSLFLNDLKYLVFFYGLRTGFDVPFWCNGGVCGALELA